MKNRVMDIPQSVLQILRHNEESARKFNEIQNSILSILNFQDFFENLLNMISKTFHVPNVWISVIEESSIYNQIKSIYDSGLLKSKTGFISCDDFRSITGNSLNSILANRKIYKFKPLYPSENSDELRDIGSIAVTPITMDGEIVGSLNQGDIDIHRFNPSIDTEYLDRLGVTISICLSNVTAHEQLKFMAFHDPLTGLLNRRIMEKILEREFQRSRRYLTDLSVIFFDLDDFKSINDTFGHDLGDAALVHAADTLLKMKRRTDSVSRFAGDEFVAVLPSTNLHNSLQYITRVKEYLHKNPVITNNEKFNIQISAGAASALEKDITSPDKLLKKADQRLYDVKNKKS